LIYISYNQQIDRSLFMSQVLHRFPLKPGYKPRLYPDATQKTVISPDCLRMGDPDPVIACFLSADLIKEARPARADPEF
jgi:hypothetical protein